MCTVSMARALQSQIEQHGAEGLWCVYFNEDISPQSQGKRRSVDEGDVRRIKEEKQPSVEQHTSGAGKAAAQAAPGQPQPVLCRLCSCCSQLVSLPGRSPSCSLRPQPGCDGGSTAMVLLLPMEPHPGAVRSIRRLVTQLDLCLILP